MKTFAGVSGFSYPSWRGKFYPEKAKPEELLTYYSKALSSVEINSSFYAPPSSAMVKNWAAKTEGNFRFSFKAPKKITHILKLGEGAVEEAERLSKTLDLLGPRRGPVLFQLPPYLKHDEELLAGFLSGTSKIPARIFEFRHESWLTDSTFRQLEEHGAGFCIADTEDMEPSMRVTGEVAYFRLRKDSYSPEQVDGWARKIISVADGAAETYVYLRHDETGENGLLAQRLSLAISRRK